MVAVTLDDISSTVGHRWRRLSRRITGFELCFAVMAWLLCGESTVKGWRGSGGPSGRSPPQSRQRQS